MNADDAEIPKAQAIDEIPKAQAVEEGPIVEEEEAPLKAIPVDE
ncbi:hypothetical protein [Luteolibacter sp. Populi]